MSNPVLITGCDLITVHGTAHGDLWEVGDCYVFNAVTEPYGTINWQMGRCDSKSLSIPNEVFYFERRGVVVVMKAAASLSPEAAEHIRKWL